MQTFRKNDNNREFQKPPVNVGDEFDTIIEGVGEKGDGFTRKDGFVIFVPNVKKGDAVKVKVTKVLAKVGFGEVVGKSTTPAPAAESAPAPIPEKPAVENTEDF